MSDISIPGVSSKYNTEELIDKLMELERRPLEQSQARVDEYNEVRKGWQEINRNISRLSDQAKSLYGFQNPFGERIALSSNEGVLTATATREAMEDSKEITVMQKATADRFLSSSLPRNYEVPAGDYRYSVGDKEVVVRFKGGSLRAFAEAVNKRGKGVVAAKLVNDTIDTTVLLLESQRTGSGNSMFFGDDAVKLGLDSGMLKEEYGTSRKVELTEAGVRQDSATAGQITLDGTSATLLPGGSFTIPITPPVNREDKFVLDMTVSVKSLPDTYQPPPPPSGPDIPATGSVQFQGITVTSDPADVDLPGWTPPPPPPRVDDLEVIYITDSGREIALPSLQDGEQDQNIRVPLDEFESVTAINIRNKNTHRQIAVSNIKVYDPTARGEYSPANPVSQAGDAVLLIDGIRVVRSDNVIDDLIPGVSLSIQRADSSPIKVDVQPDRELIKNSIISFVGDYNRLMADINIFTGRDDTIIEELEYLSDDEREQAYQRLGLFQGEIALMQLESRMKTIVMNPYPTSSEDGISLLAQIGISTNSSGFGGGVQGYRLRGYLAMDEATFDNALATMLPTVHELFGADTDQDLVVDTGAAYMLDNFMKAYSDAGGVIPTRVANVENSIARESRKIETLTQKLEQVEADYRRKYGVMEGAISGLEEASRQLDNFNKQNQN